MAKAAYMGVAGVAQKIKKMYVGVNGVARRVKKAYIGVGGVARLFYSSGAESGVYLLGPDFVLHQVNPDTMAYLTSCQLPNPNIYTRNGQVACGAPDKMYYPQEATRTLWEIDPLTGAWLRDTGVSSLGHQFSGGGAPWPRTYASSGTELIISEMCRDNMSWVANGFKRYDALTGALRAQTGNLKDQFIQGNGEPGQFIYAWGWYDEYNYTRMARGDVNTLAKIADITAWGDNWGYAWGQSAPYYAGYYYITQASTLRKMSAVTLAQVATFGIGRNSNATSII
jgi:hypothetical protein